MQDPADNPRTGAFYMHHPPVPRRRPWRRVAFTVGLVFAVGVALAAFAAGRDPSSVRQASRHVDAMDATALHQGAAAVDERLTTLFDASEAISAVGHAVSSPSADQVEAEPANSPPTPRVEAASLEPASAVGVARAAQGAPLPQAPEPEPASRLPRELEAMTVADGVRTLRLTLAQANAWLRVNLPDWARAHDFDLPPQVTRPVLGVDGDRLVMAFRYSGRLYTQSFSVAFTTHFGPDGKARLAVEGVRAGSLPLPMGAVASTLDGISLGGHEARQAGRWIDRMQGLEFSPTLRLANGRKLRVVGYRPDSDGIELSLRAEPSKPASRTAAR